MRAWQDGIHENVFSPAGLLRIGPRAARLSTAEYNRQKAAKEQQAKDAERSAALALQIDGQKGQIRKMLREAGTSAKTLTRDAVALHGEEVDLLIREGDAASLAARGS